MNEYGFELALAAHLERERDDIVSRQLGTGIHGRRVMDLVCVEPGPAFDDRAVITSETIPPRAIESDVGPGRFRYWASAFEESSDHARTIVERAVACGFFEDERRNGRRYVRQAVRYPDWFGRLVGIENKPDLGSPGALQTQLLTDVSAGVLDAVILATNSYVTRTHRNRIPDEVGIWRFDPETGERDVLREPQELSTDEPGIEILDRTSVRTSVRVITPTEKRRTRRRIAERAYGKGWRTYDLPGCTQITPATDERPDAQATAGLPYCSWANSVVHPTTACGPECEGFEAAESPPSVDQERLRATRTRWEPDPDGRVRTQSGLNQFTGSSGESVESRRDYTGRRNP